MAVRAIRSVRLAGSKVVAVYSEADANALHVRLADESVLIGAAAPESSYLDVAALIEAAQVSSAGAVLPVHAILAGSAELAMATTGAGLLWIGADPDALAATEEAGWGRALAPDQSPGAVIGLADGFRIDGLAVRRTRTAGACLFWTSAEEPAGLAIDGLPSPAAVLATASELVVGLGWQGLVSVAFGPDGAPMAVRGGVCEALGLVELRAGRDLVQAAIALAEGGPPPGGSPGSPAAVGGVLRATAVPGAGQRALITQFSRPLGENVRWEPGYAAGDFLWPWYDPVLAVVGVPGSDLSEALAGFLTSTSAVGFPGIPNDLDQLRERAEDVAAQLHDRSA